MTIDEYLARELMGWTRVDKKVIEYGPAYDRRQLDMGPAYIGEKGLITKCEDWHPSTSIEQALGDGGPGTVRGAMGQRGYYLATTESAGKHYAIFLPESERIHHPLDLTKWAGPMELPAAAISEAARKALEGEGR